MEKRGNIHESRNERGGLAHRYGYAGNTHESMNDIYIICPLFVYQYCTAHSLPLPISVVNPVFIDCIR